MRKETLAALRCYMETAGSWTLLAWPEPGKSTYTEAITKYSMTLEYAPFSKEGLVKVASVIERSATPEKFMQAFDEIIQGVAHLNTGRPKPRGDYTDNIFIFDGTGRTVQFYDRWYPEHDRQTPVFSGDVKKFRRFLLSSPHYLRRD